MKIVENKLQKNTSNKYLFCFVLFCFSVSINFITLSNIDESLKYWVILNIHQNELSKNVQMIILTALWAEELTYEKRKEFYGTPCKSS